MIVFYFILLILGAYLMLKLYIQLQQAQRNKNMLRSLTKEKERKPLATLNYRQIIIHNSPWLQWLDNVDRQVSVKLKTFGALALSLLLLTTFHLVNMSRSGIGALLMLAMIVIIVAPGLLVGSTIKSRLKAMMDALPYLVDLVAVCVQSGMTVESALKFVSHRFNHLDANLAGLMAVLIKRAEVSGMEEALSELYHSMAMTEIRMFTATLQQSVHYGTSLYEHLIELAQDIRELQILNTEDKIGSLSAKMSVPLIIFIMFPITILIVAPGILRILKNGMF